MLDGIAQRYDLEWTEVDRQFRANSDISGCLGFVTLVPRDVWRAFEAGIQLRQTKLVGPTGWLPESVALSERCGSRAILVVGYATVGLQDGQLSHAEFERQTEMIESACERRGLSLLELVREREPRRGSALERPGLGYALELIAAGKANGLVVAELSRLTHSVPDLGRVLGWLSHTDARLVAAGLDLDTGADAGRLALRTIIEISQWERERLAERTRQGMLAARQKGPPNVADDPELAERITGMRTDGMTLQGISDRLNAEGVPTVRGGAKWRPSSVQAAAGYRRRPATDKFGFPIPGISAM